MLIRDWSAAEAAAQEEIARWSTDGPGGVVIGLENGMQRFAAAAGQNDGAALGPDSVFRWASVTKHVFAACLLECGALPLDMPLGAALPDLAAAPAAVTVAQALAMQGGLPDTRESLTLLGFGPHDRTEAEALYRWSARIDRLNVAPGTEVNYSNGGYRLLEVAMERRGFAFGDMVADHARRLGLGMRVSQYWSDPVPGLVPGYLPDGTVWCEGHQGMHLSAAGSLSGSARDLGVWLGDLMPRAILARMAQPQPLVSGAATGYGLGLRLSRIAGAAVPGHGGAQPGYRAAFLCDPPTGTALIVLCNRDDGDATGTAARIWRRLHRVAACPEPAGTWAPPGLYVAPEGDLWVEVREGSIVVRDAEELVFQGPDGWVLSNAPQFQARLRFEDGMLHGSLFHRAVRLLPVTPGQDEPALDGRWACDGAVLRITGTRLFWGIGPRQCVADLTPLGNGRWLFHANGRRICLTRLAPDRIALSLARSRVIEYHRS